MGQVWNRFMCWCFVKHSSSLRMTSYALDDEKHRHHTPHRKYTKYEQELDDRRDMMDDDKWCHVFPQKKWRLHQATQQSKVYIHLKKKNILCKHVFERIRFQNESDILEILQKDGKAQICFPIEVCIDRKLLVFPRGDQDLLTWINTYQDWYFIKELRAQVMRWWWDMVTILKFLYDHHVEHYDIKLENLILTGETTPRLQCIDFGCSIHDAIEYQENEGTIGFMAPEVNVRTNRDLRSVYVRQSMDVYSLVCTWMRFMIFCVREHPPSHVVSTKTFHPRLWTWDHYEIWQQWVKDLQHIHPLWKKMFVTALDISPLTRLSFEELHEKCKYVLCDEKIPILSCECTGY